MKNTLVAALLTLTIAAMGEKALCCGTYRDESGSVHTNCAAVMVGVPDVIVGDRATDPSSNVFVFPDAFTIRASFPSVASSSIIWTFTTDNLIQSPLLPEWASTRGSLIVRPQQ